MYRLHARPSVRSSSSFNRIRSASALLLLNPIDLSSFTPRSNHHRRVYSSRFRSRDDVRMELSSRLSSVSTFVRLAVRRRRVNGAICPSESHLVFPAPWLFNLSKFGIIVIHGLTMLCIRGFRVYGSLREQDDVGGARTRIRRHSRPPPHRRDVDGNASNACRASVYRFTREFAVIWCLNRSHTRSE